MEHACSKCGAAVTDGLPFCPHCKHPQIRVPGLESSSSAGTDPTSAGEEVLPRPRTVSPPGLHPQTILWHQALPSAVFGGVVSIVALVLLPVAGWGPAYALGGAVAMFVYRLRARTARLTPAMGAKVGAASAGFGFSILAIITVATYVYHTDDLRKAMDDAIQQMAARGSDPHTAQQALELLKTQEGLGLFVAFGLSMLLIVFVIASSVGGALCASWLRRRP
jgi:hypothetical protein